MSELIEAVTRKEVKAIMDVSSLNRIIEEINLLLLERGKAVYHFELTDNRAKTIVEHFKQAGWEVSVDIDRTVLDVFGNSKKILNIS